MSESQPGQGTPDGAAEKAGVGGKVSRRVGIFGSLLAYLWKEKMWWMIPMILVLAGFTLLAMIAGSTGIAPFVYTLF